MKSARIRIIRTPPKNREPFFKKENDDDFTARDSGDHFFYKKSPLVQPMAIDQPNGGFKTPSHLIQSKCAECDQEETLQKSETSLSERHVQKKSIFESNEPPPDADMQLKCAECEEENTLQQKQDNGTEGSMINNRLNYAKYNGNVLPEDTRSNMEDAFGVGFGAVRIHTGSDAVQMNKELGAQAFTYGSDIFFNSGKYDTQSEKGTQLLAHELTHVVQQGKAIDRTIQRHTVAPTTTDLEDKTTILAMTLSEFVRYTQRQADWFTHSTLTSGDRDDLWRILLKSPRGGPVLAGVGDVLVSELIPVTPAQWTNLEVYCRGAHAGSTTVSITPGGALADRIALGGTLREMETVIDKPTLELCVRQADLETVHNEGLIIGLKLYWLFFSPFLQQAHTKPSGGKIEFERIIDLLKGPGIFPFLSLLGRVRNLHRFSPTALTKLVANFNNRSNNIASPASKPLYLVLHTGLDSSGAFQQSAHLFEALIQNNSKLTLMLEGQGSLDQITSMVPSIAANYGKPDAGGIPRIAQVLIAGHGSSRSVTLAGTPGAEDKMDLDDPAQRTKTELLLNTLMDNMDPATARIVYAGCLVGVRPAPSISDNAAGIAAHYANPANQSLVGFTEGLAAAKGMPGMPVQGARASVGLGSSASLLDSSGNLHVDYTFDPTAFGDALTYIATGREPEGVMRAALEVAATNSNVVAANQLRIQLARSITNSWYDNVTHAFAAEALDGVAVGAGVDVVKLNKLVHMVEPFFLAGFGNMNVGNFATTINSQSALALSMYTRIVAIPHMSSPPNPKAEKGRFIMEQGWTLLDSGRASQLIAYLDATPGLTTRFVKTYLNLPWMKHGNTNTVLFPSGASASVGRMRLAIAWILKDQGGDDILTYQSRINQDVKSFLDAQVDASGTRPRLKAPVIAELISASDEDTILEMLGRLTPSIPAGGGSSTTLDPANVNVFPEPSGPAMNDVRVETNPYIATVIEPAYVLAVRTQPSMRGRPFHWLKRGETVRVMGFTHNWAAVDINGRLGFAFKTYLSSP